MDCTQRSTLPGRLNSMDAQRSDCTTQTTMNGCVLLHYWEGPAVLSLGWNENQSQFPRRKRNSMIWKRPESPVANKFKTMTCAKKVMVTVFWDRKGLFFINFIHKTKQLMLTVTMKIHTNYWKLFIGCSPKMQSFYMKMQLSILVREKLRSQKDGVKNSWTSSWVPTQPWSGSLWFQSVQGAEETFFRKTIFI